MSWRCGITTGTCAAAAAKAALNLAETAHQLAPDGAIAKQLTLDAGYPTTEGPVEVATLARIKTGGWVESDQQETAALESLRAGIDDALAGAVAGDRAKARQAFANGPAQVDGAAFALYLSKGLAEGAAIFDHHHARDPQKLITLCNEGEESLKAALALLKDAPNADEQKEATKLQDKFKALRKDK